MEMAPTVVGRVVRTRVCATGSLVRSGLREGPLGRGALPAESWLIATGEAGSLTGERRSNSSRPASGHTSGGWSSCLNGSGQDTRRQAPSRQSRCPVTGKRFRPRDGCISDRYFAIDDGTNHFAAVAIIIVKRLVQALAVVPDDQHVRFPAQAAVELLASSPPAQEIQQRF